MESPIESNGLPSCEPEMGDESAGLDQSLPDEQQDPPSPSVPKERVATSYINVSCMLLILWCRTIVPNFTEKVV